MRTAAEESRPQDYKNSSTGYEPNDYFLTETYVEFNQESVTLAIRTEDESITLKEEGLSSGLSSSSTSHYRTGKPRCRNVTKVTSQVTKFRDNSENEQIRTLLDRQREQILSDCQAEMRKHEFQAEYDRRSIQHFNEKIES